MEHSNKISAVAVPIYNKNKIIAALSCPYFSDNIDEIHIHNIVIDMIEAGKNNRIIFYRIILNIFKLIRSYGNTIKPPSLSISSW